MQNASIQRAEDIVNLFTSLTTTKMYQMQQLLSKLLDTIETLLSEAFSLLYWASTEPQKLVHGA